MGLIKLATLTDVVPSPKFRKTGGKSLAIGNAATNELLGHNGINCVHIRNKFTLATWFNHSGLAGPTREVFNIRDTASNNNVIILSGGATDTLCQIRTPGSTTLEKNYRTTGWTGGVWWHICMVVDRSASEQLLIYRNGILLSPTKTTDTALSDRGSFIAEDFFEWADALDGSIHSWAIWNDALNANEVIKIYNNGNETFNLLKNAGKYKSSKKLQHWFVPEANEGDMGKDYGRHKDDPVEIDIMTDATNVTVADDLTVNTPSGR